MLIKFTWLEPQTERPEQLQGLIKEDNSKSVFFGNEANNDIYAGQRKPIAGPIQQGFGGKPSYRNEIRKLKMQAEACAFLGHEGKLPAEVENQFLQQVYQFEEAWQNVKCAKVYDLLGRPVDKRIANLNEKKI